MKKILITDTLFIFPEHKQKLRDAGFELERLPKSNATEEELIEALQGVHGYILGGIEKVTDKVIESASELEAVCFTGSDWRYFISGHKKALEKGIKITNCPGANSGAVAEYTLTLILAMTRGIFDLGRTGNVGYKTTSSVLNSKIGIIGMGIIGEKVTRMLKGIGVRDIYYHNRTRKSELEKELGITYLPIEELLPWVDIVTLHTSKQAGEGYFGKNYFDLMKPNALLVNCSFQTALDYNELYQYLDQGKLRVANDGWPTIDERYKTLPLSVWFNSNQHTAYNTDEAAKNGSDMATQSIINLLSGKGDQYEVKED